MIWGYKPFWYLSSERYLIIVLKQITYLALMSSCFMHFELLYSKVLVYNYD